MLSDVLGQTVWPPNWLYRLWDTHQMIYFFHINRKDGLHFPRGRSTPGGANRDYTSRMRTDINKGIHDMLAHSHLM